jgi:hypothetical protein
MQPLVKQCPKCAHVRLPEETDAPERCPACGLYFVKWAARQDALPVPPLLLSADDDAESGWRAALKERLVHIPENISLPQVYGCAALLVFFLVWGMRIAALDYRVGEMGGSFMHVILLPFHEAGHVLFRPLGEFMMILGGSLFQVLFPLIVAAALLWQNRDPFGAALGIWWCGISFIDLAPYIYDAKNPQLILLGGHTGEDGPHDWIYLLDVFGKVQQSPHYGFIAHKFGILLMLAALVAAAIVLLCRYRACT